MCVQALTASIAGAFKSSGNMVLSWDSTLSKFISFFLVNYTIDSQNFRIIHSQRSIENLNRKTVPFRSFGQCKPCSTSSPCSLRPYFCRRADHPGRRASASETSGRTTSASCPWTPAAVFLSSAQSEYMYTPTSLGFYPDALTAASDSSHQVSSSSRPK